MTTGTTTTTITSSDFRRSHTGVNQINLPPRLPFFGRTSATLVSSVPSHNNNLHRLESSSKTDDDEITDNSTIMSSINSPEDLVGVKFDIEYQSDHSQDTYHFEVLSSDKVLWKRIQGKNVGQGDTEDYVVTVLKPNVVLMTRIEADG